MKAISILVLYALFFLTQISFAFAQSDGYGVSDDDVDDQFLHCSALYLELEHKLNQSYDLLTQAEIGRSLELFEEIRSSLENARIPIKEKIALANKLSQGYFDHHEYKKGLLFSQKYLEIAKQSLSKTDYQLAKAYEVVAAFQIGFGEFERCFENLMHASNILKSHSGEILIYMYLGDYYKNIDEYQKSIDEYKLAIKNINQEDKSNKYLRHQFSIYSSYYYSSIFFQDDAKAYECILKLESLSEQIGDPLLNFEVDLHNGYYYYCLDEFDTASEYLDQKLPNHPFTDLFKSEYYNLNGMVARSQGKYNKAIEMLNLGLDYELSTSNTEEQLGNIYYELGLTYSEMDQPDMALKAFDHSLCTFENLEGNYSLTLDEIGWVYFREGQFELALNYFLEAFEFKHENTICNISSVEGIMSVYLENYRQSGEYKYVDSVLHFLDIQDNLLTQLRVEDRYFSDQSSVEYNIYVSYIFILETLEELLKLCDQCNYLLDPFFKYIEGVKAYSFKQELKAQDGLHTFGVPNALIDEIKQNKKEVKNIQDELYKLKYLKSNLDSIISIEELIEAKNQQLYTSIDNYNSTLLKVETNYPNYFNYKFNDSFVSIQDIQNLLNPQEVFIEYFTSKNSIFIISMKNDTVHYFHKNKPEDWTSIIEDYSNSVTNSNYQHQDSTSITYSKFTNSSHQLYNILMKDALDLLGEETTHLTVVPDEQLHFIQFDNLLTQKPKPETFYKDLDYLINDFTISRSESAFIYSTVKNKPRQHKKYKYVGFAPKYNDEEITIVDSIESERKERIEYLKNFVARGACDDLPTVRNSVYSISSILDGISFIGQEATKHAFLRESSEGNIVHFAGHAIVDQEPKFSQLLFSHMSIDSQLYASDIYDMGLDVDLAVLSACNTGIGLTKLGEGVMSLSRAFKFAGCSSLVMSLWNIPDVQTAEIDYHFFENIKKGERVDDALRNSKLKFLSEATYQTAHPFFWSGLTASGKMEPIYRISILDKVCNYFKNKLAI